MTTSNYPRSDVSTKVERLKVTPEKGKGRRWVLRDDNDQHYHGVLSLDESPVSIELRWKPNKSGREQIVGHYRLHLAELLAADFIRFEREGTVGKQVRLRFYRGAAGVIFIQSRMDRPALPIGQIALDE